MKATELDKMKQDVIRSLAKNDLHVGSAGKELFMNRNTLTNYRYKIIADTGYDPATFFGCAELMKQLGEI